METQKVSRAWETSDPMVDAPDAATFKFSRCVWRVRRWPKGNRVRIECGPMEGLTEPGFDYDPSSPHTWLWVLDAATDEHGFLSVADWSKDVERGSGSPASFYALVCAHAQIALVEQAGGVQYCYPHQPALCVVDGGAR